MLEVKFEKRKVGGRDLNPERVEVIGRRHTLTKNSTRRPNDKIHSGPPGRSGEWSLCSALIQKQFMPLKQPPL